jgi:hypothetical protein
VNSVALYELEENLVALLDSEPGNNAPEELVQEWLADVAAANQAAVAKRDRTIQFLQHMGHMEEAITQEIGRLQARKKSYTAGVKRLKEYVLSVMQQAEVKKLEGTIGRFVRVENPSSAEVLDVDALPTSYLRSVTVTMAPEEYGRLANHFVTKVIHVEKTPDKAAILKALKAGEIIPGADLKFGAERVDCK